MENRSAFLAPCRLLQMPDRVGQLPGMPRRAAVPPRQMDGVARVVVGPPGFVLVGRAMPSKGFRTAGRGLLVGHRARRHSVDQHVETSASNPTEEVEVLQTEE